MSPLISGLILAAVSGLTFVAYKHPKEYRTIEVLLFVGGGAVMAILAIWNASADLLFTKLGLRGAEAPLKVLAQHKVMDDYLLAVWISFFLFLGLLRMLPALGIVDKKTEERPDHPKQDEPKEKA